MPEAVTALTGLGHQVLVEPGAGLGALIADDEYTAAGAEIAEQPWSAAELVISVQPMDGERRRQLAAGTATLSFLPATLMPTDLVARRDQGLTSFAMDYVPRISRAQSMDALSSQSLVSGYRGAVVAAGRLRKFFPLSMTAAGTVKPAQVLVLGAGVAGLQAIATAKRLGAVVKGYDVRAAAAEEIASLGAIPIDLRLDTLDGAGGYAREMTAERAAVQRERLAPFVAAADALITTAAVPGRQAPVLVTRAMVEGMRLGSVVVDLAADTGGNVEGVQPGAVVQMGGAQVWGGSNVAAQMPGPASRLYAQNVLSVITLMTHEGAFSPDFDDAIVAGMCLTHAGEIRNAMLLGLISDLDLPNHDTHDEHGGSDE